MNSNNKSNLFQSEHQLGYKHIFILLNITGYGEATKYNLENVNISYDAIISNYVNCIDDAHTYATNVFDDNIVEYIMANSSVELVSRQGGRTTPYKRVENILLDRISVTLSQCPISLDFRKT